MKKLYIKLLVFGGLYLSIVCAFLVLSAQEKWSGFIEIATKSEDYVLEGYGTSEIIPFIERVQEHNDYTKLVLGDSVCHQLFDRYYEFNDVYCISGSNQAISLAGQYILAEEFVKNHENVTDIYLVLTMGSLATDFGAQLGYQYAVMPFVKTDTINDLDDETLDEIADIYGGFFCLKPVVNIIDASPLNKKLYLNALAQKEERFPAESDGVISQVTYRYLEKLYDLCEEEGITLHVIPGPHADSEARHKLEEQIAEEINSKGDKLKLQGYLDQIVYYPEWMFRDGIHFDEKKVNEETLRNVAKTLLPEIKIQ